MKRRGLLSCFAVTIVPICLAILSVRCRSYAEGQPVSGTGVRAANPSPAYLRLKMVRIVDSDTFSEPIEVTRMLIPADWKFEGKAKWFLENRACPEMENISAVTFRVQSPDGLWSLERFPNSFWTWAVNPVIEGEEHKNRCPFHEPVSPASYVSDQLLPKMRPGAQILFEQPATEMSRAVTEILKHSNATAVYLKNETAKAECARVTYEYPEGGKFIRESILGTMITMISRRPVYISTGRQNSVRYSDYYSIHASDFNASRVPDGESGTSEAIFARIMMSLRANPRWIAGRREVASHLAHSPEDSEAVLRHNELPEMTDQQIASAYQKQVEARTPTAKEYDPSVLPMESYIDPGTNEGIELNGGFAFGWTNHRDEYILTNEANFNPAAQFNEDWILLRHATSNRR